MINGNNTKERLQKEIVKMRKRITRLENSKGKTISSKKTGKQAENDLWCSNELHRLFFKNVNDAIFIYEGPTSKGLPGKIIEVNQFAHKWLGYTRDELLKKDPTDIDVSDTFSQAVSKMKELIKKKYSVREGVFITKGGRRIPVEIRSHLVKLNGKPLIFSAVKDITSRKKEEEINRQVEKALRESEQRFKTLSEASFEGISVTENGIIVDLNEQHAKMHGYKRKELIGKHVLDLVAPESRERLVEAIRKGEKGPIEYLDLCSDGKKIYVEVRSSAVMIDGHELVISAVRDMTKRKQSEESLQYERNLLRMLVDNLPDLFYVKDAQCQYVINNPAHLRSIGAKSQKEVLGKTTFDTHPYELAEKYFKDEKKVVQSGEAIIRQEELCFRKDTGQMHWHLTSKIPVMDNKSLVTGLVCISHDITEQKRVQEAFQRERNVLRTLIDNLPDIIYFKDTEGHYVLNNLAHLHSIGAEHQEDVLGKTTFDYHPREWAEHYHKDEMEIIRSGKKIVQKEEIALHSDTGEVRWHLTSKIPIVNGKGDVAGIVGISRDITDRKHAEEALQSERNLLRTLIDNLPDYIYVKDIDGRFIVANQAVAQQLGFASTSELIGKSDFDLFPRKLAELYFADEQAIQKSDRGIFSYEGPTIDESKEEKERWISTTKVVLKDAQGKIIGFVGLGRDITEKNKAEIERERLIAELQEAFADIKTLSGLVPICANCKKIRDDKGYWTQVEAYIQERSQARFSHGICPDCMKKLYPEYLPKGKE